MKCHERTILKISITYFPLFFRQMALFMQYRFLVYVLLLLLVTDRGIYSFFFEGIMSELIAMYVERYVTTKKIVYLKTRRKQRSLL